MRPTLASVRESLATLRRDSRTPILAVVAGGWFLSLGVRLVYPAILPQLRSAYGISLSLAGLLLSVLWLAYAIGQLPGGILSDRFGERTVLVASTFISGATLGLVVVADAVGVLFAATALFGLSTALYGVARFTVLSNVYPKNDGMAIGVTMGAGDLGNAVLPPLGGFLAVTFVWQAGLGFAIPLFLLATVGLLVAFPSDERIRPTTAQNESGSSEGNGPGSSEGNEPGSSEGNGPESADGNESTSSDDCETASSGGPDDASARESRMAAALATTRSILGAFRNRTFAIVAIIQTLGYFAWQAFTGFYPTYLIEMKGFEPTTATLLFGGFFALGVVVKPISGRAFDAYGARRTLPVLLLAAGAGLAALPFVDSLLGVIGLTLFLSGLLGYSTVTLTYLTASLPTAVQGAGLGAVRTGYMGIGAASPVLAGTLAEAGFFDETFFLYAGLVAIGGVSGLFLPRSTS